MLKKLLLDDRIQTNMSRKTDGSTFDFVSVSPGAAVTSAGLKPALSAHKSQPSHSPQAEYLMNCRYVDHIAGRSALTCLSLQREQPKPLYSAVIIC